MSKIHKTNYCIHNQNQERLSKWECKKSIFKNIKGKNNASYLFQVVVNCVQKTFGLQHVTKFMKLYKFLPAKTWDIYKVQTNVEHKSRNLFLFRKYLTSCEMS